MKVFEEFREIMGENLMSKKNCQSIKLSVIVPVYNTKILVFT